MVHLLAFGSSITGGAGGRIGYVARLRARLADATVYNVGVGGEASPGLRERFRREAPPRVYDPDTNVVLLELGVNDARIESGERVASPDTFEANVRALREAAHDRVEVVRFLDVFPSDERVDPAPWNPDHRWPVGDLAVYDERLRAVVPDEEVVPVRERFAGRTDDLLADGLHPNAAGHAAIAAAVAADLDAAGVGEWGPSVDL